MQQGNMSQASIIPIPEKFTWEWIRRFERYRIASGLSNKTEAEQVSTLLYAMGECADDILKMLQIVEDKDSYEEVKAALGNFSGRRTCLLSVLVLIVEC